MNGKRARLLRKKVYGAEAQRGGLYSIIERIKKVLTKDEDGKVVKVNTLTLQIICVGKRAEYRKAKKAYKKSRR